MTTWMDGIFSRGGGAVAQKVAAFAEARNAVLADNIANIDTAQYKTKDLSLAEFQQTLAAAQARVNQIHQIGAQATARMNATEAANSAEQASWNAGQNANAQNNQGFSNYLLDQSVVQNNSTGAHGTLWNNAAEGLVQSNPSKYSYVTNPNLVPGTDF